MRANLAERCSPGTLSSYTREPRRRGVLPRAEYFTGLRFGSIFVRPVPFFTSMIWSRRSAALFEFEIRRGGLHLAARVRAEVR